MRWGVEAISDFAEHSGNAEELKHEEGAKDSIKKLESLMRGHHIENNSADNSKIAGSSSGETAKTSLYGKGKQSGIDLKTKKIKKALNDFPKQVKNEKNWQEKQYKEKKKEIIENGRNWKLGAVISNYNGVW